MLVNLIVDTLLTAPKTKFSVYRLLVNIWQHEVQQPLFYDSEVLDDCYRKACEVAVESALRVPKDLKPMMVHPFVIYDERHSTADTDFSVDGGDSRDTDFSLKSIVADFDSTEFRAKYFIEQ